MKTLIIFIAALCFSLSSFSQEEEPKKVSKAKAKSSSSWSKVFGGKKSVLVDFGFSANMLLSDLSTPVIGLGLGNQTSVVMNFNRYGEKGLKLIFQGAKAKENNFRKSEVDNTNFYRSFEQEWNFLGAGIETRKSNRLVNWYWDWILGYAFGKKSRIQTQAAGIDQPIVNGEEASRSFLYLSAGGGIRKKLAKKWYLNSSFRTYAILGSIYGDQLKSKSFVLLPLMANFGVEYSF